MGLMVFYVIFNGIFCNVFLMVFNVVTYVEIDVFEWFWGNFPFQNKAHKWSVSFLFLLALFG